MLRFLGLLAYVLVSMSVGMTSIAHAMEPAGGTTIAASATTLVAELGHTQGDSDEVPADSDKGYPHHHVSCHGDHLATAYECGGNVLASTRPDEMTLGALFPLPSRATDPALRPPQA
jgi:hypothetical protein